MSERWTPFFFGKGKQNAVLDEQGRLVASVGSKERGGDESKDTDANLIASSPELLSNLEAIIQDIDDWYGSLATLGVPPKHPFSNLERAKAAAAKARGEEDDDGA